MMIAKVVSTVERIRQSRPDSGPGLSHFWQENSKAFKLFPFRSAAVLEILAATRNSNFRALWDFGQQPSSSLLLSSLELSDTNVYEP